MTLPLGLEAPRYILIVDDERYSRDLLEVVLEAEGFEVATANSAAAALAMIAVRRPDLMLLDIMMPDMDGYQLATRVRSIPANGSIPIIMLSVLADREARMLGLRAGADDFLTKPVDRAELCARVRNLLRLKAYGDYHNSYSQILETEVIARTAELLERTNHLEAQAVAFRHSEARTNFALGGARMGMWELEIATDKMTWSDTLAPVFGLTPDQAPRTGDDFFALIHADDRTILKEAIEEDMRTGGSHEVEFRVVWPDQSIHWTAGRACLVHEADGTGARMVGVGSDITARRSLEAQLRQSQKMEAVGQLAGGVAHDFNNILSAILGYSTFVIDSFEPEDPRRADMAEITKAGDRAVALTRQLLAFSRKQVMQPAIVDLNELVLSMRGMLSPLIGEQISLVPILANDLGAVRADRGQLEQVLLNLVVNARDAMSAGGRLVIETANVELDGCFSQGTEVRPGSYVMLAVSDNGVGMTESTRQRLFEPFFTTKEQGSGTGLGLATVYGIVHQSGGHVWVYSEPGNGATFKVYLPRTGSCSDGDVPPVPIAVLPVATETILLVEDDDAVRALTRTILSRSGYHVLDAPNPAVAEALFEQHLDAITLVVTDVIMPGSSGPRMFERLAQRRPALKVLYVSGYTDDAIVNQGRLDPGVDFLQKPFTAAALNAMVREVLERV